MAQNIKDFPDSISIIIPVYNEGGSIAEVLEEVLKFISEYKEISWELIVVDDGSTDNTASILRQFESIKFLQHPYNCGYGASLKTGIRSAKGSYVLSMDADGQHIADEISKIIDGSKKYDMVVGERSSASSPLRRRPGKYLLKIIARSMIWENIPDINSGQRLIKRETILKYMHVCSNKFSFSTSTSIALISEGHFVKFVKVDTRRRRSGYSQVKAVTAFRMLLQIFRVIMVFHPLRFFLPISSLFCLLSISSLINDIITENVSDLTLMLVLLTSVTMLLGLISDQIAHVRRELQSR